MREVECDGDMKVEVGCGVWGVGVSFEGGCFS